MNKRIRRLGMFLLACYVALFAMLNYIQVYEADSLNDNEFNARGTLETLRQPRGAVETADGVVVARSVPSNDRFEFQREYPEGDLFGHITGFFPVNGRATGVEREYNDELAGQTFEQELRSFADLFIDRERTGNVTLTLRDDVQRVARDQLGQRRGSVVVVDVDTGGIVALWSYPSYNPNPLSSHDVEEARAAFNFLDPTSGTSPLRASSFQNTFFPGSTFKVVTGSIGVQSGRVTPEEPVYPSVSSYTPPQTTRPLSNFAGEVCGGTLFTILAQSCNTSFAQMGTETLGPDIMVDGVASFGFNQVPPIDLPGAVESRFPVDFADNLPALAQASIGQGDNSATPLQMALVAAAVANDGVMMAPHVMREIRDGEGAVVDDEPVDAWKTPISPEVASTMRQAMYGVVQGGTLTGVAEIPGFDVGGKTGTAQTGNGTNNTWVIEFVGPPGQKPEYAIAVIVENQGADETGGGVAGPIARAVLEQVLQDPAG
jgi:peptidoglycan glycosyltransferase